jgi:exodeoxyribonuclease V alpha subunit
MKPVVDLSPLGTARVGAKNASIPEGEQALLNWLAPVKERLASAFAIEEEVVFLAWELARWPVELQAEERQALALLALTALVALRQGSTRLPLRNDEGREVRLEVARRLLDDARAGPGLGPAQAVDVADALIDSGRASAVLGVAGEFKPLVVAGSHLYLQKMHALEQQFATSLLGRMTERVPEWDEKAAAEAVRGVQERPAVRQAKPLPLSADQVAAVETAVRFHLAVISGGPGTGKTTIVVSILRALCRLGVKPEEMVLAAPTGKAAHRLGEAVRWGLEAVAEKSPEDRLLENLAEPQTLHRLLGYSQSTGRFLYHQNNRLAARVVVVDEASMIDLVLMERLTRSLRDDARLVLLGDDHQLPSVEAGAVLRDLIAGESPLGRRAVRLTESYRMRPEDPDGRNILTVSRLIDSGTLPTFDPQRTDADVVREQASVATVRFQGVEFLEAPEGSGVLNEFLEHWHKEVIRKPRDFDFDAIVNREYVLGRDGFGDDDRAALAKLFKHFDEARILCLTRVRSTGADRINAVLHRRALVNRTSRRGDEPIPGEPVMMQVNDPGRRIFNGDQGLVLRVSEGGRSALMVVFPRDEGFRAFGIDALRPVLLPAFALTVHKAQGSEYDHIALVLPDADIPINAREILYTALTRARTSVTILGTREVFAGGVARRIHRSSGLAEMLQSGLGLVRTASGSTR